MGWPERTSDGKFRAAWRDAQGQKRYKRGFTREADARRYACDQEARIRRGEFVPSGRSMTWGEWLERWKPLRVLEASTTKSDEYRLARVKERWEHVRLNHIANEDIQAWVNQLATAPRGPRDPATGELPPPLAPATVIRIFHLLSASLADAVRKKHLGANPALYIDLPFIPEGDPKFLDRAEVDAIFTHLTDPYLAFEEVLVGTGARPSEAAGLHIGRIERENNRILIAEVYDAATGMIKPYPKGRRRRWVPIVPWLEPTLDRLLAEDDGRGCGVPHKDGATCRSRLLITAPRGGALDPRNVRKRHWEPAVERAGLVGVDQRDLRHTFASWLLQSGVSLDRVREILGHTSTRTTQIYARFDVDDFSDVRRAVAARGPATQQGNVIAFPGHRRTAR